MLNTKNDIELTPGPTDGANSLSFSPVADYLAASSWDGQVMLSMTEIVLIDVLLSLYFRLGYGK